MILPIALDAVPYAAGLFIARLLRWSPLAKAVTIRIEDSGDDRLRQLRISGTVRAFDCRAVGQPLLIQLHETLRVEGPRSCRYVEFVVATSALRWHGPSRLLLTWAATRLVDASAFVDQNFQRTIGIGRLTLH